MRLSYDLEHSDNGFAFGGPRIPALVAIGQFIPLPDVTNTWHRFSVDVQRYFTRRVGIGVGYYFEKLDIVDFSTVDTSGPVGTFGSLVVPQTGVPRIDWLGGLITGYNPRPYSGNTAFFRLLYRF